MSTMKHTDPGTTLVIGRLFDLPGNPRLRRVFHAALSLRGRLVRWTPPAAERCITVGATYSLGNLARREDATGFAGEDEAQSNPNFDDARAEGVEAVRTLIAQASRGTETAALRYRGLNLADVCTQPFLWVLAKTHLAQKEIADALAAHWPARVLVEDPSSVERQLVDRVLESGSRHVRAETILPGWLSWPAAWLLRAMAIAYTLRREGRARYRYAEIDRQAAPGNFVRRGSGGLVLFASMGDISTRATLPVLEHLIRTSDARVAIMHPARLTEEVDALVHRVGGLMGEVRTIRPAPLPLIVKHLLSLATLRRALAACRVAFHGVPFLSLLQSSNTYFSDVTIPAVKAWIDTWALEIERIRPTVVVTGNDWDWHFKVIGRLAESRGAETVHLEDGFGVRSALFAFSGAKHQLVTGPSMVGPMTEFGIPAEDIHPVGSAKYDLVVTEERRSRPDVCADLAISPDRSVVVIISHHNIDKTEKEQEISAVLEAARSLPDAQFVFKLHPYEGDGLVQRMVDERGLRAATRVCQHYNTFDLVAAADVVIVVRYSSCGAEAMMFDTPVILLNLGGARDLIPYVEDNAAIGVYRQEDLLPALDALLFRPEYAAHYRAAGREFVRRHVGEIDGQAKKRIVRFLELPGGDASWPDSVPPEEGGAPVSLAG